MERQEAPVECSGKNDVDEILREHNFKIPEVLNVAHYHTGERHSLSLPIDHSRRRNYVLPPAGACVGQ